MDYVEAFDLFGEPIKLRYRGRTTVHTTSGGFLSCLFVLVWVYFTETKVMEYIGGQSGQLSTTMIINNIAKQNNLVSLKESGFDERSLMVGVNTPEDEKFDNEVNKFFVYRAFMIDNQHNEVANVKIK